MLNICVSGATVNGIQVHSLRPPGNIKEGWYRMLAARRLGGITRVVRGLDKLRFGPEA